MGNLFRSEILKGVVMLIAIFFVFSNGSAFARLITVTGNAPIINGNIAAAEEEATNDALRRAVEQEAGVLLQSFTQMQNLEVVRDDIFSNARGFITNYKPLFKTTSSDGITYHVTVEADVNTLNMQNRIKSQESGFVIHQEQMENKNIIILGIKQFGSDITWASKVFELTVNMAKDKLTQAQFIVLDEGSIENYKAVAENLKNVNWSKAALYELGEKARADWMLVIGMDALPFKVDKSNLFDRVEVSIRMELLDINLKNVITTKYDKGEQTLSNSRPRMSDWQEAAVDAGRKVAELEITDIVNFLMDGSRTSNPGEPHRYIIEFERFQDEHVNEILTDMQQIPGYASFKIQKQGPRFTAVQYFYTGRSFTLQTALKKILSDYGYNNPRINIGGNKIHFENKNRF